MKTFSRTEEFDINIIFGEKVKKIIGNKIITTKDNEVISDVIISCLGFTPNTKSMKNDSMKDCLNEQGYVFVNETLQVYKKKKIDGMNFSSTLENVFCGGDIVDIKEEKLGK
jgi:thioredoxin reductase